VKGKGITLILCHKLQLQLRLRNDLYCVGWGVKPYSLQLQLQRRCTSETERAYSLV